MSKLTPRQQLFVDNYMVHYNAARAVKQTYGENPHARGTDAWHRFEASARARGSENLTKPNVLQAVRLRQARIRQRFEFDEDMVVSALAGIVFTDLRHVGDWDEEGRFRLNTPENISDFHHGAIRGIRHRLTKTTRSKTDDAGAEEVVEESSLEVLLHRDKVAAAKLLLQHGGWLGRTVKVHADDGATVNVDAREQLLVLGKKLESMTMEEILAAAERMPADPGDE